MLVKHAACKPLFASQQLFRCGHQLEPQNSSYQQQKRLYNYTYIIVQTVLCCTLWYVLSAGPSRANVGCRTVGEVAVPGLSASQNTYHIYEKCMVQLGYGRRSWCS